MMWDDGCVFSSDQTPASPNSGVGVQVCSSVSVPSIHIWMILPDQWASYLVHTINGSILGWLDCDVDILSNRFSI